MTAGIESWQGPPRHVMALERHGRAMSLDAARRAADFIFATPSPALSIELCARSLEAAWPAAWFLVQYIQLRAEWSKREVRMFLRAAEPIEPARLEFLGARKVILRADLALRGAPEPGVRPPFPAARALAEVRRDSAAPAAWMDWLLAMGFSAVLLAPEAGLLEAVKGRKLFLDFYSRALDQLELIGRDKLVEEGQEAFLKRQPWHLPGLDVLGELAYGPEGDVYTSEFALGLGDSPFKLGRADELKYPDLSHNETVRACLAASHAENQPRCFQCRYKAYCAVSPSRHWALQSAIWGQTPSSPLCALNMALLDLISPRDRV
ncbi:MAG: hypothetical protein HY921_02530 [Elusimicrobia bacterium]|nr:hypothetical protein [Elusimicrobiota bacterium]